MLALVFAILSFLGAFAHGPAMDADPAPIASASSTAFETPAPAPAPAPEPAPPVSDVEASPSASAPTIDCTPWLVPDTDEGFARSQELQAAGWAGDPTDGMEALYPPGC